MNANLIVTASDRAYGDFLIEHWLESLRAHNRLDGIDIAVIDYGLSVAQRFYLERNGVHLIPGVRDGHVAVIRYREMREFLIVHSEYDQVLMCDSGDIIFQGDIAPLFTEQTHTFRAVPEDHKPLFSLFISSEFFDKRTRNRLLDCFVLHPMINGGFVLGPRQGMIGLADECLALIKDRTKFGPDQIVLNGYLYQEGFVPLDPIYNYVVATAKEGVWIENGRFRTMSNRVPVVVHNAGNVGALRPIRDFGYGSDRNALKEEVYTALHALYQSTEGLFRTQELFLQSRRRFVSRFRRIVSEFKHFTHMDDPPV